MNASVPLPEGFRAAGIHCGLKGGGELDLGMIVADTPRPVAAIFTRNQLVGAHVPVCRDHLARSGGLVRAVVVNSGNANCGIGPRGLQDARAVCRATGALLDCPVEQVLFVSTGVIGAPLPVERITSGLEALRDRISPDGLEDFARAIMTTDTRAKLCSEAGSDAEGRSFLAAGVAKGSGMIHPDMATMLAFSIIDGRSTLDMHMVLRDIAERTWHRVTVDGDTSPNDTVLLWYDTDRWLRGAVDEHGVEQDPCADVLLGLHRRLARMVAADGEGATRLVTVQVRGASSEIEARRVGRVIATSALVKTAIFGRDPNWGRILAAAGRSGVPFPVDGVRVWIGDAELFAKGRAHPENEPEAAAHLREHEEVVIGVDLGLGPFEADVWTCDLSPRYVEINADYRT